MDRTIHRRAHPRLNLGIEAKFISLDGPETVILQDLSATGAKIQLARDEPLSKGILVWMDYEVFGDILWRDAFLCGISFDRPISNSCLVATRAAAPGLIKDASLSTARYAKDFVSGYRS